MKVRFGLLSLLLAGLQVGALAAATRNDAALWRPRFATPALVALDSAANRQFTAEVRASFAANGWSVSVSNDLSAWSCTVVSATYSTINRGTEPGWRVLVSVPMEVPPELFTVVVASTESVSVQSQAVSVMPAFAADFYILHMADEQIVQEFPKGSTSGRWYGSVGTAQEFSWEREPIDLIHPRFVMVTGDQVDYNGALDAYNNWANWGSLYGSKYDYQPSGERNFTQQETSDIAAKLASLYFAYHVFRVPYVSCPGNHDVPPAGKTLAGTSIKWHSLGADFYEANWGQRSWSFRMGDFYVLMHDWSESALKTWAANDYGAASADPTVKYRLIGQHANGDQAYLPSSCNLMLVGHGHTTATLQSSPYYIYEDGPAFDYGKCGFFNFKRNANGWTCDQTVSARNTSTSVWPLYTDNGTTKKVRSNRPDAMNITATSVTINNDLPQNFYDGRVRFVLNKGVYHWVTNGTILAQYDCYNGTKTAVLVKVNIPASGSITVTMGPATVATGSLALDPHAFSSHLRLTFSGYSRGETLTNFPVLVNLSASLPGFAYRQFASPSGGDLRFSDSSGTNALLHEIDEWNPNGTSRIWVRVPRLSGTNDFIWAYWGNPAATTPPAWTGNGSVWSSDHFLAWHLKESTLPIVDSAWQYPALLGQPPASATGWVGLGGAFDGTSDYLDAQTIEVGPAFTLSALVKLDARATNCQTLWANKPGGWNSAGFAWFVNSYNTADQQLRLETGNGTGGKTAATASGAVSFGQWHHLAAVVDRTAGKARLYVDGVDRTVNSSIAIDFATQAGVNLGRLTNDNSYFKGTLDEVRLENTLRSTDWLWASYQTVAANSALASYSVVNPQPTLSVAPNAGGPVLAWPYHAGVFALYTATNLTPPVNWVAATNAAVLVNNQWQVQLGTNDTRRFYRLQQ